MRFFSASFLALAGITAYASPFEPAPKSQRDVTNPLVELGDLPLTTQIMALGEGKVEVSISKSKINWGDQPPWDVIARMEDECDTSNCSAEFKQKTTVLYSERAKKELELTIDTGPSDYDDWIKQGLARILVLVLKQPDVVEIKRKQLWTTGCRGFQCQNEKNEFYDQYLGTRRISVRFTHPDGHFSTMQFDVRDNTDEVSKEGCKDAWSSAGTVGGVVSPFAGLLGLGGTLFCD